MQEGRFYGGLSEFELAERCSVAQQSCDCTQKYQISD